MLWSKRAHYTKNNTLLLLLLLFVRSAFFLYMSSHTHAFTEHKQTLFNKYKISRGALIILIYLYVVTAAVATALFCAILYAMFILWLHHVFFYSGATRFLHHYHQHRSSRQRCHRYCHCLHYFHRHLFCAIEHIGWLTGWLIPFAWLVRGLACKCEHFKYSCTLSFGCFIRTSLSLTIFPLFIGRVAFNTQ